MDDVRRSCDLAAERLLRATVRDSNRMFAGSRVGVAVADAAVSEIVHTRLLALGAHLWDGGDAEPDFWVTDSVQGDSSAVPLTAHARIDRASQLMPATRFIASGLKSSEVLLGTRVAVSLVLEPKTAVLALALRDAGAEVHVFGAVSETQVAVAAALADRGITVSAPLTEIPPEMGLRDRIDARHAAAVLDWQPELLIDDGSHLIRLAHTRNGGAALRTLRVASEETTSGVRPLREMEMLGELRIPVVAVNDARTKIDFDNRIGTGESCVLAIADAIDRGASVPDLGVGIAGAHWVVLGYGPVGVGVARVARAFGARVSVVERDAVRALAAFHEGFEVGGKAELLPSADVVVSATGVRHTLVAADFLLLRAGAVVAVAGGIDDELALEELFAHGWHTEAVVHPNVLHRWSPPHAAHRGVIVVAAGGGVNYTIANGNPVEVMDLSFATQLAALSWICSEQLEVGVHVLPRSAEERVARAALSGRGAAADPSPEGVSGETAQIWRVHRYQTDTP